MPYDKETRDALQAYYETHDFTGSIPAFDDKKYTTAQLQIYAKAKKFFAQSWLKLLPKTGNKRSMRNFSKNYPLNCLKEGDAAYIADMVAQIMGDEEQLKASVDKFFSYLTCRSRSKPDSEPVQRRTEKRLRIDRRRNRRCCGQTCRAFHGRDDQRTDDGTENAGNLCGTP